MGTIRFWITRRRFAALLATTLLVLTLHHSKSFAGELDAQTRMDLQLSLQAYIENKTEDGLFPFFNAETGETDFLVLRNLHPAIFKKRDYYLMCADFSDENDEAVLIDYIVRQHRDGYRVEQEIRGRRSYLTQIFDRIF